MVVKHNQRRLCDELSWFFHTPPLPCEAPWREVTWVKKGHGRLETRQVTCTADLDDYLMWPGVRHVLRRPCQRIIMKTGEVSTSVTYGVMSLRPAEATPADLAALWQGHWTIENRAKPFGCCKLAWPDFKTARYPTTLRNRIVKFTP